MEATITLQCELFRKERLYIRLATKSELVKNQVESVIFPKLLRLSSWCLRLDIYVVADAEGNQMVLKLHRYSKLVPSFFSLINSYYID